MTWMSDTISALRHLGGKARLSEIVVQVAKIRSSKNEHIGWVSLTVGLILNKNRDGYGQNIFTKVSRGVYQLKDPYLLKFTEPPIQTLEKWGVKEIEQFEHEIQQETNFLKQFEKIIDSAETTERDIGEFLKKNPSIFGLHYVNASSEDKIGLNGRTDFLMEKVDGYYDIIELKGPNDKIFSQDKERNYLVWTPVAKNAICQIINYLNKYDLLYLSQKEETQKDVLYPKGIIVMGKRTEAEKKVLKIHNHFLNHIEIKTYNDIFDDIKTSIDNLDKIRTITVEEKV